MNDVYLQGSDEVARAGRRIGEAADTMRQAVAESDLVVHKISVRLNEFQDFLDDWLNRLEAVMKPIEKSRQRDRE